MSRPRVLVADDQVDVQEALRLLLKGAGYDVDTVGSPRALLAQAQARHYDLILLDMNYTRDTTSGDEGLDLLAHLRAMNGPPVIMMTAWSDVELAVEAMKRGACDFVQKPWDNARVIGTVRKHAPQAGRPVQSDMELAQTIQQRLLPPPAATIDGIEYSGKCVPAMRVGGDYYDVLQLDADHTAFLIADVSGKGTAAALLMSNLQACFRAQVAVALRSTSELLQVVNKLFIDASGPEHFVTLFFARYCHSTGNLDYINCGHPGPVLVRGDGSWMTLDPTCTVLGVFPAWSCAEQSVPLAPGDVLLMFSDGVLECSGPSGPQFEPEALANVVASVSNGELRSTTDRVVEAAQALSLTVPHDDLTVLAVRRNH